MTGLILNLLDFKIMFCSLEREKLSCYKLQILISTYKNTFYTMETKISQNATEIFNLDK